ncbi:MAG: protein kinase, partial [Acidobacteria bacterium]|nr:protein kinase [Acidobacteriota bacterium]
MSVPPVIKGRYEINEVLGKGGMGVVYRAFDSVVKREIALKTVLDIADAKALELFQREYEVLASISHPNIVEIFDLGSYEEKGESIPYFVMPLLGGMTLDKLIRSSSHRLTVERAVAIITQTCRGLQAAHERGLIHRDLKPSNIFVMEDDSARIIDFGVVHKADALTTRGWKGTLQYMAPELIEMKPPSVLSDIFSLGVVAYEALTQRRPFELPSQHAILQAILHHIPPAASEINSAVSQTISQVVHKAMAKQPYHRFSSVRELAETLQKAFRGEPLEIFDPARIQPRIQRAGKAFEQGDYQFADEILSELQAEGHIDPAMTLLRGQLDQAIRQKRIRQLLDSARTRFEEEEYPLALQKVQEALELAPDNAAALSLQREIEQRRTEGKIEDWFRLASQHIDNHAYGHAREALQRVLEIKPAETHAHQMLAEIDRREEEYLAVREEKEQLYEAAMEAWKIGEVSSALHRLERALDLDKRAPDSSVPERSATYQTFYKQVRSEYDTMNNSYAEARKHVTDRNFAKAIAICDEYLAKYPGNALFQALKFDIEEEQRQELSSTIAEIDREVDAEPDLGKRVNILKEALERHPGEGHFERALRIMREKRDLVNSIVAKAQLHEERGQFTEALGQWEILQTIYSQYPGLNFEIERVRKRRDQQSRLEAKGRVVAQIDRELHLGDFRRALDHLKKAKAEFPKDAELAELEKLALQGIERTAEAERLFQQGQELCAQKRFEEGMETLRKAHQLDEANPAIRAALVQTLVEQARSVVDKDWPVAEELTRQALALDPGHAQAKSLRTLALDRECEEFVDGCLAQARQLQTAGDLEGAQKVVEQGLATYPRNPRLGQLHGTLGVAILESQRRQARRRDLEELGRLDREAEAVANAASAKQLSGRLQTIARKYSDDSEVLSVAKNIETRLAKVLSPLEKVPPKPVDRRAAPPAPKAGVPAPVPPAPAVEETMLLRGTPLSPPPSAPEVKPPAKPPAGQRPVAYPPPPMPTLKPGEAKVPVVAGEGEVEGWAAVERGPRRVSWTLIDAAALAIIFVVAVYFVWRSRQPPPVATVPFVVRTSPQGATIRIDG